MQLYFVLPLVYHILLFTLGFVDMSSSWLLWIPKVVHWYFVYLDFLIPYLEARSPILMDFFHLYILHNGPSSLWLCARFWEGLFWTHLKKFSLTTEPCKYIYIYTYMLEFYLNIYVHTCTCTFKLNTNLHIYRYISSFQNI